MTAYIVLGRFQPFHKGHAHLVSKAHEMLSSNDELVVAIGSKQAEWEPNNPWTSEERHAMIQAWADAQDITCNIVAIDDINDPPNWVDHASKSHGIGTLVTSDTTTKDLYEAADGSVYWIDLHQREQFEGWRVRQSCMMLSTVYDDDAIRSVLTPSVPSAIIEWLITNDALYRFLQLNAGPHAG